MGCSFSRGNFESKQFSLSLEMAELHLIHTHTHTPLCIDYFTACNLDSVVFETAEQSLVHSRRTHSHRETPGYLGKYAD